MGVLFLPGQSEHLAYEGEDPQVGEAIRFRDFSLTLVSSFTEGSGILRTDAEIEESSQALELQILRMQLNNPASLDYTDKQFFQTSAAYEEQKRGASNHL